MAKRSSSPTCELSYSGYTRVIKQVCTFAKSLNYLLFFQMTYARSSGVRNFAVTGKSTRTETTSHSYLSFKLNLADNVPVSARNPTATVAIPSNICDELDSNLNIHGTAAHKYPRPRFQSLCAIHELNRKGKKPRERSWINISSSLLVR